MGHHRALVVGGAGFLGSHIVQALVSRNDQDVVAVFDIVEPPDKEKIDGVDYYLGDIVDEARLVDVLKQIAAIVVYHAASPIHGLPSSIYYRVNEEGTRVLLSACQKANVKYLIYTSSTGVVWTGEDFHGVTEEEAKVPSKGYDAYHDSKALGERLVLGQNSLSGMKTVVLRPCGMFGERDKQLTPRLARILKAGRQNVQIGDNTNIIDYLYAGNAAYAHLLAAKRLADNPEGVAGQIFFITDGSPTPQWDFARMLWRALGDDGKKRIVKIPRILALLMAMLAEFLSTLTGKKTDFTTFSVRFVTGTQWYSIEKARKMLEYEPQIPLEEGIRLTAQWWKGAGDQEPADRFVAKKTV